MPSASYGPLQATGPRPSPKPRRKGPQQDRVGSQERVPKGCATGPRVPSTTATATLQGRGKGTGPQPTDDVRASPSGGSSHAHVGQGTRIRPRAAQQRSSGVPRGNPAQRPSPQGPRTRGVGSLGPGLLPPRGRRISYLVDPASSHMLVSKIKPCMSKYRPKQGETANGSLNQLWFIGSYPFLLG